MSCSLDPELDPHNCLLYAATFRSVANISETHPGFVMQLTACTIPDRNALPGRHGC